MWPQLEIILLDRLISNFSAMADARARCARCLAADIPCVFDEATDRRRGRKRRLGELNTKADAFDTLIESIQSSDDRSVQELLKLARAERPVDELVQAAKAVLRRNELLGNFAPGSSMQSSALIP